MIVDGKSSSRWFPNICNCLLKCAGKREPEIRLPFLLDKWNIFEGLVVFITLSK